MQKGKISKTIQYILILLFLILSGSGIQVIYPKQTSIILILETAVLIFVFILNIRTNKSNSISFIIMILFCTMVINSFLFNCDLIKFKSYIVAIGIIICAYLIANLYDAEEIIDTYTKIIYFFAVISIICYFIVNATGKLPFSKLYTSDNSLYKYHSIFIYNWIDGLSQRNCGPFWEPGIFASHLIITMQFEILFKRKNKILLIILAIAVITCNSSAGFLLLAVVIAEYLIISSKPQEKSISRSVINFVVIATLFVIMLNLDSIIKNTDLINNEYFKKLLSENIANSTRGLSLEYNLKAFIESPLFGNGLTKSLTYEYGQLLNPDTTTSVYMLNVYGIFGLLYSVVFILGIWRIPGLSMASKLCFIASVLIIINKEPHYIIAITWCFMFMALNRIIQTKRMTDNMLSSKNIKYLVTRYDKRL